MLRMIITKELKSILSSPKFVVIFAACSILILLSVWVGIQDYRTGMQRVQTSFQNHNQFMRNVTWERIRTRAFRQPDFMQIFVSGVNNDIGRLSDIQARTMVKLENSVFEDDTIFAVFRFIDFSFIVQMVLSLIAILFTYDAINGERESGTLQLTFSNPVPRARFILGKFIGSWLGLVIPLLIPILLAILLILLMGIPMTSLHWQKLGGLLGVSLVFLTFFIVLGIMTSTLTRRSASSLLISLVAWILFVFIIPRISVVTANQFVRVPSVSEMESRLAAFSRTQSDNMNAKERKRSQQIFSKAMASGKTPAEREAALKKANEDLRKEISTANNETQKVIADYALKMNEERRNQQARQERFAFTLSRISPASAFRLAAMNLAGTDIGMKKRVEDSMIEFRTMILALGEKKTRERGSIIGTGSSQISTNLVRNSDGTITASRKRTDNATLTAAEVPVFIEQPQSFRDTVSNTLVDMGLLAIFSLVTFSVAFLSFLRYDVR